MKTIIIEQEIYKVSEREFKVLKEMESEIKKEATLGVMQSLKAEDKLNEYLDVAKIMYKYVGTVDFHCQR